MYIHAVSSEYLYFYSMGQRIRDSWHGISFLVFWRLSPVEFSEERRKKYVWQKHIFLIIFSEWGSVCGMMPIRKKCLRMLFRRAAYSLLTGFENFDNNYNGRNIEYAVCNSTVLFPLNFENMDAALCQYLYV